MIRNTFSKIIWKIGRSSTFRRIANYIGVNDQLNNAFNRILLTTVNDPVTVGIGDSNARFRLTTTSEYSILNEQSESNIITDIISRVKEDDVFWDVGANIGLYTCLVAPKVSTVVSFEPFPGNVSRLRENVSLNDLDGRVEVHEYALSDKSKTGRLQILNDNVGTGQNRILSNGGQSGGEIEIEERSGDDLVREGIPSPTILKIDVEGVELKVLNGFKETLSEARLVYCEVHDDRVADKSKTEIAEKLGEHGFEVETALDRGDQTILRATEESDVTGTVSR